MSPNPSRLPDGLLIVFEGLDGVGKSTQLSLTRDKLEAAGWPVHTTRNLGGTPIGEALRDVMLSHFERPAETDLYLSLAIQEALLTAIATERAKGKIILMDRGPLSLAAYQIYGSGLNKSLGWRYVESAMLELEPDLTIMYKAPAKLAADRARQKPRPDDYFESKPLEYFERVADGYSIAARRYKSRTVVLDAGLPIQIVHQETMMVIDRLLKRKISAA